MYIEIEEGIFELYYGLAPCSIFSKQYAESAESVQKL